MEIDIDYLINKTNINKEELEKLQDFEIRKAFERTIDIAKSYGLRVVNSYKYTFTEDTDKVDLTTLSPPYDFDLSFINDVFKKDYKTRITHYFVTLDENKKPILVFGQTFLKDDVIVIIYTTPYNLQTDIQGNIIYQLEINVSHLNIIQLIFEGSLYERLAQYYSKLSMQEVGAEISNNMDRARYYNEQATRFYSDAVKIIKKEFVIGKSLFTSSYNNWLTHDV